MSKLPQGKLDTLIHMRWLTVLICGHSLARVRKQHNLLSPWRRLLCVRLYLPEGQHDAIAQVCNTEELMHDNQGTFSHTSPICSSLMPLLMYCLTLKTPGAHVLPQHGKRLFAEQPSSDLGTKVFKFTSWMQQCLLLHLLHFCVNLALELLSLTFVSDLVFFGHGQLS